MSQTDLSTLTAIGRVPLPFNCPAISKKSLSKGGGGFLSANAPLVAPAPKMITAGNLISKIIWGLVAYPSRMHLTSQRRLLKINQTGVAIFPITLLGKFIR